jgi:GTP-binding protein HflX
MKRARVLHEVSENGQLERAHLVGVMLPGDKREDASSSLEELGALVLAAGGEVAGQSLQARTRIEGATYIGSGKVEELRDVAREEGATLIVFDHDLTPAQARNVEEETKIKVIDRSELILDIFARRARTGMARAQVELAQLEYQLPRLTNLWQHLSRLGGGIGTRGPGETQLEVDRRRVRERIKHLRESLKKVERVRAVQRKGRRNLISVALVGYTNAGKSSLMNRLAGADVFVEDQVFATLDTTTRLVSLSTQYPILLTDTVGFIHKLPHQLIASFHATLEEVVTADLLLVVVDGSDRRHMAQLETVNDVLEQIGAGDKRRLLVVNKSDRFDRGDGDGRGRGHVAGDADEALRLLRLHGPGVVVSARTGDGIDDLRRSLEEFSRESGTSVRVEMPLSAARDLAELHARAQVLDSEFTPEVVRLVARVRTEDVGWLRQRGYRVLPASGSPEG